MQKNNVSSIFYIYEIYINFMRDYFIVLFMKDYFILFYFCTKHENKVDFPSKKIKSHYFFYENFIMYCFFDAFIENDKIEC